MITKFLNLKFKMKICDDSNKVSHYQSTTHSDGTQSPLHHHHHQSLPPNKNPLPSTMMHSASPLNTLTLQLDCTDIYPHIPKKTQIFEPAHSPPIFDLMKLYLRKKV